jgi:hypothetical protein
LPGRFDVPGQAEALMASRDFGIYILTYPGDFHLSAVLVRSIQHVNPDIPIMIIPGEGFDLDDHPFDVSIMPEPTGFWAEIGHQDRCFWAFQGPFETFLYLDADMICTKSLENLRQRVVQQQGSFIFVQPSISDEQWLALIHDPNHPEHQKWARRLKREIGRDCLTKFDPDYEIFANRPFSSGVFASRRFAITESNVQSLNQAEREFYRDSIKKTWTWKSSKVFFRDQGRLNYLVNKLSIPVFRLRSELICLAGASAIQVSFDDVERNLCEFHMIHWAGSVNPSPSWFSVKPLFAIYAFLCCATDGWVAPDYHRLPECTGYSLWRHYHEQSCGAIPLRERLRWSWRDLKETGNLFIHWLKLSLRGEGSGEGSTARADRPGRTPT